MSTFQFVTLYYQMATKDIATKLFIDLEYSEIIFN